MPNFKNLESSQLKEIHEIVSRMKFSDDNFLDFINYVDEAINIAAKVNPDRSQNSCLHNLLQTKKNNVNTMISRKYKNNVERERYFSDAQTNFLLDLRMFGF